MKNFSIAIHAGAGAIRKKHMTEAREAEYFEALSNALQTGIKALSNKRSSLEVVLEVVTELEDNPLFNAGKGSVYTRDGTIEMDASIMYGRTNRAGAVSGVSNIKNPIKLAKAVMDAPERAGAMLLCNTGAMAFAKSVDFAIETKPDEYFHTEERWQQMLRMRGTPPPNAKAPVDTIGGTVGAVALDNSNYLAAATSSGGVANKKAGRLGDSAIIGAGTYVNQTCAVSCTGFGEKGMRGLPAFDITRLIEYRGLDFREACRTEVFEKMAVLGGKGGLIAVNNKGEIQIAFNTEGMFRASFRYRDEPIISMFGDEN